MANYMSQASKADRYKAAKDYLMLKTKQSTLPRLDKTRYQPRRGLEGPFMTKSGQVVYYDKKIGQYYNSDTDMYIDYDDWKKLSEDFFAEARVLANNGQYKAVSSGGVVRIMYKGKEIASGDFDSGADGWFVSGKNDKGQKFFGDAQDMVDYFVKNKVTEDAPANATGTAVAGTGDDSSTVVVKKKKPMQDKLMRRLKIQETIDRTIPDLEYEEDEITKRTNQLKEMASNKYVGYGDAIKASIKTTEERDSWLKDIALNADKKLPYDKETDQPKKYVAGLSDKKKKAHDRHLEKQGKKSDSDKSAYKQSPADKVAKTKPSVHTKKYKQMFGESDVELNEVIKGLKKKAEKSGMPYSILKQVYNRGMAAWKGGHRPGTTPQQWAFARVNSFITKSSGTWGKADSDLAKKVRGS